MLERTAAEFTALGLDPVFAGHVAAIFNTMAATDYPLICNLQSDVLRDPWTQARYWRRSRSAAVVKAKIAELEELDAPYIAGILRDVGPQPSGPFATNAVPGASYHQHGLAIDAYPKDPLTGRGLTLDPNEDGDRYEIAVKAYALYTAAIDARGVYWGGHFSSPDTGHFQISQASILTYLGGWPALDARTKAKWPTPP